MEFTIWHQRDNDGNVEAVFASPTNTLFKSMLDHANYLLTTAETDVTASVDESDDEAIFVNFSLEPNGGTAKEAATEEHEFVSLIPGVPAAPFDAIHIDAEGHPHDGEVLAVKDCWADYDNVPDIFSLEKTQKS